MRAVLIGLAGAAGALARYRLGRLVGLHTFPWATLGINLVGSFLLGVVVLAGPHRLSADAITALAIGFLGAFTTFSTFSFETQTLIRTGRLGLAGIYVVTSVSGGVIAATLGCLAGRSLQ